MTGDIAKRSDDIPAPYGRWPDGTPITQLEASAKQMNDWAGQHGFSGSVSMSIGTQHDEPKQWHKVKVGSPEALPPPPVVPSLPAGVDVPLVPAPAPLVVVPSRQSWISKLFNLFKRFR
jgi:hypothetical protein